MRSVSRRLRRGAGALAAVVLMGTLALIPRSAGAGQAQAMPLVLPRQCLSYLPQFNGNTGFTVVCLSQVPIPNTGAAAQTAVVDLSPPGGSIGPNGSFPLFMFPQDVPLVQQLNGGMPINPVAIYQVPTRKRVPGGSGTPAQIAQVNVAEPGQVQGKTGPIGFLLVCPVPSLPLLGQLNPGLSFQVLCISQVGTGKVSPGAQTALLDIQPTQGIVDLSQPLPMLLPVDILPALGQLNVGTTLDVINVTEVPVSGRNAVLPVALVDVTQSAQAPSPPGNEQPGSPGDNEDDDSGDGHGKGHGKGHGNGQGHHKNDDNGDD